VKDYGKTLIMKEIPLSRIFAVRICRGGDFLRRKMLRNVKTRHKASKAMLT
jgi:hypothetical protein